MRTYNQDGGDGEIWPAYADILMITCLTLILLAVSMAMIRNDDHITKEREKRKEIFATAFNKSFKDEIGKKLVKLYSPIGESQTITFSDQLLFEKGDAKLQKVEGQKSLKKLSRLLVKLGKPALYESISIKGHTDEDPVQTVEFPSNWHLSSARATSVVYYFTQNGIKPTILTAMGYAEFHPQTPEGKSITDKALKRRVEVELRYPDAWIEHQAPWK